MVGADRRCRYLDQQREARNPSERQASKSLMQLTGSGEKARR